ncbi:reverse transcriptase domain-containing protein, partial [Escherichia coli]|uniref:reverse transcriptase domain-containing protein n=1 Tax=Escherichia coli TaxID=562 RepID=UPI00142DEDDF
HGELQEEVYLDQPPSYEDLSHPDYVCRLHKALYGLKQVQRAWHEKIVEYLVTIDFHMSHVDHSLYVQRVIRVL